ncbi:P-loop NTPase fold protein [Zobellia nedashkovskayae]
MDFISKLNSFKELTLEFILKRGRSTANISPIKPGILFISIILFHVFYLKIVESVNENLIMTENFSNFWLDGFIIFTSLSTIIFFSFRFWYTKYTPSETTVILLFLTSYILFNFILFSNNLNWSFFTDSILKLHYPLYFLIPIFLFLTYYIIKRTIIVLSKKPEFRSQFQSDVPINKINDDKLGYEPYVKNLGKIILNESFSKAFSIGLVGPWGNGKSSIFDLIKSEIEDNEKVLRDNIFIDFQPFLNHNEYDIINEFFILLSNQLSKFDGNISNEILNYSQKLNDLYQSKSLINFVSKSTNTQENLAAKELYNKINESLTRINKKIIVFIDDLDRLNGDEIIQVLKLIRNTGNFKNTIFIVAMDKDYVLQRLKSSDHILNSAYLEKFFQLEIYLPEIDNNLLRENFLEIFELAQDTESLDFALRIKEALSNSDILFNDYVKNIRDVKRYSNQIKFDYPFIKSEINLVDFINFTFLKTRFPSIVNQLYEDRSNLLRYDNINDLYHIEVLPESAKEEDEGKSIPLDLFNFFNSQSTTNKTIETKDLKEFKKYKIFKSIIQDNGCSDNSNKVDCDDLYLLFKTLYTLFGKKDIESSDSIQLSDNLNTLFYRKIQENNFTQKEFKDLLNFKNIEVLKSDISNLDANHKLLQLLKKLKWFKATNTDILKKVIQILIHLYQMKDEYSLNGVDVNERLNFYNKELFTKEFGESAENAKWLWNKLFTEDNLSLDKKIYLIGEIWSSRNENELWKFSKDDISEKAIEMYALKLNELKGTTWKVNQFEFYGYYHALKNINEIQPKLNELFESFWKDRDIKLLCAQTIDAVAFSSSVYRLSDVIIDIYGAKENFVSFVKKHEFAEKPEIKEYIQFLDLLQKTRFKSPIEFKFKTFTLAKERIKNIKKQYLNNSSFDEYKDYHQVILETNDKEFLYAIRSHQNYNLIPKIELYDNDDTIVSIINIYKKNANADLVKIAILLNEIGTDKLGWKAKSLDKAELINNESFLEHSSDPEKEIKIIHPKPAKF